MKNKHIKTTKKVVLAMMIAATVMNSAAPAIHAEGGDNVCCEGMDDGMIEINPKLLETPNPDANPEPQAPAPQMEEHREEYKAPDPYYIDEDGAVVELAVMETPGNNQGEQNAPVQEADAADGMDGGLIPVAPMEIETPTPDVNPEPQVEEMKAEEHHEGNQVPDPYVVNMDGQDVEIPVMRTPGNDQGVQNAPEQKDDAADGMDKGLIPVAPMEIETPNPDVKPEVQTPETQTPETQTPESQTPETQTPESQTPESQTPGSQTPAPQKEAGNAEEQGDVKQDNKNQDDDDYRLFHDDEENKGDKEQGDVKQDNKNQDDDDYRLLHDDDKNKGDKGQGDVKQDNKDQDNDDFFLFHDEDKKPGNDVKDNKNDGFEEFSKAEIDAAKSATKPVFTLTPQELDRLRRGISEAGEPLGNELAHVFYGKYEDPEDAVCAVGLATIRGFNDGIIKNIPYLGGFMHGMLSGFMDDNKAVMHDKMDDVIASIGTLTDEVEGLRNDRKEADKQGSLSNKIAATNADLEILQSMYDQHNAQFAHFLEKMTEDKRMTKADNDQISYIYTTDRKQTVDNKATDGDQYFQAYIRFADHILNLDKVNDQPLYGGTGNIFSWTDDAWSYGKKSIVEIEPERQQFTDKMESVFRQGYDVLNTSMLLERERILNVMDLCDKKIAEYDAEMAKAESEEEIEALKAKRDEYSEISGAYEYRLIRVNEDYGKLVDRKTRIDEMIGDQKDLIQSDRVAFDQIERPEKIYYFQDEFNAHEVVVTGRDKKGNETKQTVKLYPVRVDKVIEYRDIYGNVYGTQKLVEQTKNGADVKFEVGKSYYLTYGTFGEINGEGRVENRLVTITDIYEKRNGFASFFKNLFGGDDATNRTIKYDYVKNGKVCHGEVAVAELESYRKNVKVIAPEQIKYIANVKAV